ncbi:MAG: PQQ-binding-like beta-propeller repeat protein [Acidobacteria bacterium]|nr:PQQ-binding-like beta-propeller repeat protein [Acidobacteriota bacterium]MDA1236750.1 PQQ-binding-like beta-propeller repeat protein [Acidobacteriota bacterium]
MLFRNRRILFVLVLACALTALGAEPFEFAWPQWRGPNLNGSSSVARNLPVTWSATENVAWRVALPSWSAATPAIWGDTVFVTSAEEGFDGSKAETNDKILLLAISREDGSVRWQRVIGSGNQTRRKQNLTSPSPITDGRHVWSMTGSGSLQCHDFNGKEIWSRDIQGDFGDFGLNHGYASSPLLYRGKLYLQVLHGMRTDAPSYVVAIEKATGKDAWRVERPTDAVFESPDSYSTPTIVVIGGKPQLVVLGGDYVTGHDLDKGAEIWRMGGLNPERHRFYRTIASALTIGDVVYASSTRGKPFLAFRPTGTGLLPSSAVLWKNELGSDVPTPVTDGKRIFVVNDRGIVVALDAQTGHISWDRQRIEAGTYSSSPLLADGKIYAVNEEGSTTVLSAGDDFEVLAVNRLDSRTLASPVAVGNQLFIRTADALYCLAKK